MREAERGCAAWPWPGDKAQLTTAGGMGFTTWARSSHWGVCPGAWCQSWQSLRRCCSVQTEVPDSLWAPSTSDLQQQPWEPQHQAHPRLPHAFRLNPDILSVFLLRQLFASSCRRVLQSLDACFLPEMMQEEKSCSHRQAPKNLDGSTIYH